MKSNRIAVIGSGIAGMAVAIRLAARGFCVDVYEKNSEPGGKIGEIFEDGFRFDTGPSLFTMPELLEDLYHWANTPASERMSYQSLSTVCRYFFSDHKELVVPADPDEFTLLAEQVLSEPASNVRRYLSDAAKLFDLTASLFLFSPFHKWSGLIQRKNARIALHLPVLRSWISMHRHHQRVFSTPHMIQLFDRYATYNGSSPWKCPATLRMIAHLEHNMGAWFPDGGMRSLIDSLKKEADRLNVNFLMNTPVEKILYRSHKVTGVFASGSERNYDHVVCNADIAYTYQHLLPDLKKPLFFGKKSLSSSAVIFYWGIRGKHPQTGLHNVFFSPDYRQEFLDIFKEKKVPSDPTVYLYISSKMNTVDAPEDGENWFAMVNTPPEPGLFSSEQLDQIRSVVLKKISRHLGFDPEPLIMVERVNTPATLADQTNAFMGALYGNASHGIRSAFLRHPNFSRKIQNLWFIGGTVHPGGGIPLCLSSAKIAADLILKQNPGQPSRIHNNSEF